MPDQHDDDATAPEASPPETERIALPGHAKIWWLTGPLLVVSIVALIVVLAWPAPFTTISPGATFDTRKLVQTGEGATTHRHPGDFLFVTVSELGRPSFFQAIVGWLRPTVDVFPTKAVSEGRSAAEDKRYSAVLMANSKQAAAYQALSRLGYSPNEVASGVFVNQIVKGSPADGTLQAGDTITSMSVITKTKTKSVDDRPMDGLSAKVTTEVVTTKVASTPIATTQQLATYLSHTKPGQMVEVTVDRPGVSMSKKVKLRIGSQKKNDKTIPYLGIYMETRPAYKLPFTVDFDTGDVGGPSAGLALTLSLIDKLSPKGIAKGNTIAVTGTMKLDGTVGPIGGLTQKTFAVRRSNAKYFLVPKGEGSEAKKVAGPNLKIIEVSSLDDALKVLKGLPAAH